MNQSAKQMLAKRIKDADERESLVRVCACRMCAIGNPYCYRKFGGADFQIMQAIGA